MFCCEFFLWLIHENIEKNSYILGKHEEYKAEMKNKQILNYNYNLMLEIVN